MHLSQGKNRRGKQKDSLEIENNTEVSQEKERIYGIDRLNLGDPAVESESDSESILAHRRKYQMENKEYRNNSIKRQCNVLSNFFNPTKRARPKNSHYSPIL